MAVLTDKLVQRLPFATPAQKQRQVADDQQPGFYLLINQRSKTFMCRTSIKDSTTKRGRRTIKTKIADVNDMTCRQARAAALDKIAELRNNAGQRNCTGVTLREAWSEWRANLQLDGRSPRTLESYEHAIENVLRGWLDVPLADLSSDIDARRRVRDTHQKIRQDRGGYAANRAFETLRALYNFACDEIDDSLPGINPTRLVKWHKEQEADDGLTPAQLANWWQSVEKAENPIRRAMHAFICLSGHRPDAIKRAKWVDLDVSRRALRIPNPKGGEARAFDMPLSRPMLRVLNQAKKAGSMLHPEYAKKYIFPGTKGHVVEHKQNLLTASHKALRHTYAKTANDLNINALYRKLLLNHKVRDITDTYAAGSAMFESLRETQERISSALLDSR